MKKIGDLMQEIGFNKNGPDSVKEAFIKHLIKSSTGVNVTTPSEQKEMRENPDKIVALKSTPQQLSFGFLETETRQKPSKKAVS